MVWLRSKKHRRIKGCGVFTLILLYLVLVIQPQEALASISQSANYRLSSYGLSEVGNGKSSAAYDMPQEMMGEPIIGTTQSANYALGAGFIYSIQSNPPELISTIPNQTWEENTSLQDAFDLDDYFSSPDGSPLTYSVSGNDQIVVDIDQTTHMASFSQPPAFYGVEKVTFTATDEEWNSMNSNLVSLVVEGVDNPPVLDFIEDITVNETELVTITPHATDLDNDPISYSFTSPLDSNGEWQTDYDDAGQYLVTVTATDSTGLSDSQDVNITVMNVNRPPVLDPISDIVANEGDLVTINLVASDPDNDAITFYFTTPFDSQGKWQTDYDDEGQYTVTVTVSDGIDTVSQDVNITINNTNRSPQAMLTLSEQTVEPNQTITIQLQASDPDGDALSFSIKKDGQAIASGTINGTYTTTTSFSDIGDHTISATVTDPGGLTATDIKGVDVYDPNANRNAVNPVMGDFNGDSLLDLGLHNSDTGTWEICLSDEGQFRNAVDWLTNFGTSKDWLPVAGDFNGDGRVDVGIYNNTNGQLKVALSSGTSFTTSGTWLTFSDASYDWQPLTGNFNGDRYTDFGLNNKKTGEIKIALGDGSGFGSLSTWISNFGENDWMALSGDFNGDSLSDICGFKKSLGEFKVALSDAREFVDPSTWITGFAEGKNPLISDFNNDGLADVGFWDDSDFSWWYAISNGNGFVDKGVWIDSFGEASDESAHTGDFNGDGTTDAACFDRDAQGINRWRVRLSQDLPSDLLTEIDNGIGGKTQVSYDYAAKFQNDLLPFPVYVAKTIALIDTLPSDRPQETYTQEFSYSGGYYDAQEREFRGFEKITVTDPVTGNYTETYFYQGKPGQDGALKGKIEKILAYDGDGNLISQTINTWQVRESGQGSDSLGFPCIVEVTTAVWEENKTSLTARNKFSYDNIGNVTETINEGDTTKSGDERITQTTYAPPYQQGFNRVIQIMLKDKDGTTISRKEFEYDPQGNPLKENSWLYDPLAAIEEFITTTYTYDDYGNLLSTTDANNSTLTTEYGPTYHTFPKKVTNALGHTIECVYDAKFGVVTSITDANGNTTTTQYDSLGRIIHTKNAYGDTVTVYSYPDFNTKITTQLNLTTTEYIDGSGRNYKTVTQGEDGSTKRNVITQAFYNERGLKSAESLPHYEGESESDISYIRYEYDKRGRLVRTISDFPGTLKDAQASINYINPLYTETIDPQGHKKGILKDVYGNNIKITEFTQGGVYHTNYEYDLQGNLIKVTDAQGNITQIWYDSFSRKIKMDDPDMGIWSYKYDAVGNLIMQTDAKKEILEFTYDEINRLTQKTDLTNSKVLATYIYDETSQPNRIGRLSKVIDTNCETEFFYDKLGREIKTIKTIDDDDDDDDNNNDDDDDSSYTVERAYDVLDRLTSLKYPDGETVNYTYDANSGYLEKVAGSQTYVANITYNAQGQILTIQYGNGTQTDYTYGQDLRLSRILTNNATSTLQDLNYIFDKNGNLTTLTDNLRSNIREFSYDDLDRLTNAKNIPDQSGGYTNFNYQYDPIGNMTYKSDVGVMEYGNGAGPHAVTSAGGYSYSYDANGNMISGKNKTLEYDAENRLTKVTTSTSTTQFFYDGDGGRVKKVTPDGEETIYIGSLYETTNDAAKKSIFLGQNRICQVEANEVYYYHQDHIGSSNVITDKDGTQVALYEYKPYGENSKTDGSFSTDIRFTGKRLDTSTGLYYYGARYYDPGLGRFITADSVVIRPGDPQDLNRYAYARNNPVIYTDPTGHGWFKNFFKKFFGTIASVAFTLVGMPYVGAIVGSAISTIANRGSFGDFAIGLGVGIVSGFAGGSISGSIARTFGMDLAGIGTALMRGGLGGALGGMGVAAIYNQDIGKGAWQGALGGMAVGSIMWAKNTMVTNRFLRNNVAWDASVSQADRAVFTQAIREAGQSPLGQRSFGKIMSQNRTITIHTRVQPGGGVPFAGSNDMHLNPNIRATQTFPAANYNQLPTIDMGTLFLHELGHNLGYTDRYTPAHPGQSLNVSYSENPYRAWIGTPARTGYWRDGDVPFKRWLFQY